MTPAEIAALSDADLARALVAHPRWEWREGARVANGYRLDADGHIDGVPDLDDDATAGVLMGMLRELGMLNIGAHYSLAAGVHRRWYVSVPIDDVRFATHYGRTLAVAAARALLAAWGAP